MNSNFFTEVLAIAVLVFLFQGDPDVWDKLHEKAMTSINTEQCK